MQNNLNELPDAYKMAIQQARSNLVDFSIATSPKYIPNWHHDLIAKELQHIEQHGARDYKILVVAVPPRHGKSQQISIDFPAWYLGKHPDEEIITSSYSAELVGDCGGKAGEKVNSQDYKVIFPDTILREDERARGRWRTLQGGSYTAVGVCGPITGRGAKVFVIDDPIKNREEAESLVQREKLYDWLTSVVMTRMEPNGVIVLVMTRWHMDDLVGRIEKHPELSKRSRVIRLPAMAENDEAKRKAGEALWQDRFSLKDLGDIKSAIGPYDWGALYQGVPILTENQEFKISYIKTIQEKDVQQKNCRRFLTIYTAMSKKKEADNTGFVDNRMDRDNFWYIRAWKKRIGPEELIESLFTLQGLYHYEKIGIEKTAYYEGLKPFLDGEQRKRHTFLPIVELEHRQVNKEIRIRGLIPRYASGSIFHIENECRDLEEEMLQFPLGRHDDVLDSLAYQLHLAENTGIILTEEQKGMLILKR